MSHVLFCFVLYSFISIPLVLFALFVDIYRFHFQEFSVDLVELIFFFYFGVAMLMNLKGHRTGVTQLHCIKHDLITSIWLIFVPFDITVSILSCLFYTCVIHFYRKLISFSKIFVFLLFSVCYFSSFLLSKLDLM